MKRHLTRLVLLLTFSGSVCLAQTSQPAEVNDFKPASSNQPGRQHPQVNSEGRARIRIVAPEAQNVRCDLGGGISLTKGEDGAWVGTTRPLDEGFHYYQITLDGAQFPDPGSMFFYGAGRWAAALKFPPRTRTSTPSRTSPRTDTPESILFQDHQRLASLLRLHAA